MKLLTTLGVALVYLCCSQGARADSFGSGVNTFEIEFVTIGDPGNPADTDDGSTQAGIQNFGSVSYSYRIGNHEISERMIAKANILGGLGITQNNAGPNKPATAITWNEAARFINWLNMTSGSVPAYKFAVQPGDVGYNVNSDIELWSINDPGYNPANLYRNSLAKYFLPSVDEWYKAAFFDPVSGAYYDYPTGSNSAPLAVANGTAPRTAVYNQPFPVPDSSPQEWVADVMLAGGLSPYGTMGQGGNVYEWEETSFDSANGPPSESARGVRGGIWYGSSFELRSSSRGHSLPWQASGDCGFRIASIAIPEPNSLFLVAFASVGMLQRTRKSGAGSSAATPCP